MGIELKIKEEQISVEHIENKRFGNSIANGIEIVGRDDNGRMHVYGWEIDDIDDLSWIGVLGVRVDSAAAFTRNEVIILEGFGEWIPEGESNV